MPWSGEIGSLACYFYLSVWACESDWEDSALRYSLHVGGVLNNPETAVQVQSCRSDRYRWSKSRFYMYTGNEWLVAQMHLSWGKSSIFRWCQTSELKEFLNSARCWFFSLLLVTLFIVAVFNLESVDKILADCICYYGFEVWDDDKTACHAWVSLCTCFVFSWLLIHILLLFFLCVLTQVLMWLFGVYSVFSVFNILHITNAFSWWFRAHR